MSSNIPDLPKSSGRFSSKAKKKRGSDLTTRDLQGLATGAQRVLHHDENITHPDPTSPSQVRKGPDPNDESFETTKEIEIVDESNEYELDEEEVSFQEDNMDNYDINELKNPDDYVESTDNRDDKFKETESYEDMKQFFQGMENRIETNLSSAITQSFNQSIGQLGNMLITAINSNQQASSNENGIWHI